MYIENAVSASSTTNTFKNCHSTDSGAIFWVTKTPLTVSATTF